MEEICTGPGLTSLAPDEILVSLTIPAPQANSGAAFLRFIPRNEMDIAVANAAARVDLDETGETIRAARIAIGAVGPGPPVRGKRPAPPSAANPLTMSRLPRRPRIARDASTPINDMRGTVEHRKQLVEVLTARRYDAPATGPKILSGDRPEVCPQACPPRPPAHTSKGTTEKN